jgi:protein-tyrosine phosphatase
MPADISALPGLPPARSSFGKYRVCLVCLGNICRSPMAEVVLSDELERAGLAGLVEVDSAGTGDWHVGRPMDAGARAELARRGYDGSAHRARLFDAAWFPERDLVLAMDHRNLAQLRRMAPDGDCAGPRLLMFRSFDPALAGGVAADRYDGEVPDPYGGGRPDYALAFDLVQAAAGGLTTALARFLGVSAAEPGGS